MHIRTICAGAALILTAGLLAPLAAAGLSDPAAAVEQTRASAAASETNTAATESLKTAATESLEIDASPSASLHCYRVAFACAREGATCTLYDGAGDVLAQNLTAKTGTEKLAPGRYTLEDEEGQAIFLLWPNGTLHMSATSTFGWTDGEIIYLEQPLAALTVTLTLPAGAVDFSAGDPTVFLTLRDSAGGETWRPAEFDPTLEPDADGNLTLTCVFSGLAAGDWTLTAEPSDGYAADATSQALALTAGQTGCLTVRLSALTG